MTQEWETFKNAPIVEAILDLRFQPSGRSKVEALADCFSDVSDRYPIREDHIEFAVSVHASKGQSSVGHNQGQTGYRFLSPERNRLVQARVNGFTVNHLKPYDDWETLRSNGQELWTKFCNVAEPGAVTRVALRYVNRINVLPDSSPREYLNIGVRFSGELGQSLAEYENPYNVQLQLTDERRRAGAIVRCFSEPNAAAHILDIDVFRTGEFSPTDDELWNIFDELRDWKNELFFAATTEKAREGFRQ